MDVGSVVKNMLRIDDEDDDFEISIIDSFLGAPKIIHDTIQKYWDSIDTKVTSSMDEGINFSD